jgi:hypothetical protein
MGAIGVHARMPGHEVFEPSQDLRRLEYFERRAVRLEPRDAGWDGRE